MKNEKNIMLAKRGVFAMIVLFICVSLTACSSTKYNDAAQHYNDGNYAAALEIYEKVGTF